MEKITEELENKLERLNKGEKVEFTEEESKLLGGINDDSLADEFEE